MMLREASIQPKLSDKEEKQTTYNHVLMGGVHRVDNGNL